MDGDSCSLSVLNGTAWFVGEICGGWMLDGGDRESMATTDEGTADGWDRMGLCSVKSSNVEESKGAERTVGGEPERARAPGSVPSPSATRPSPTPGLSSPSTPSIALLCYLSHPPWLIPRRARRPPRRPARRALLAPLALSPPLLLPMGLVPVQPLTLAARPWVGLTGRVRLPATRRPQALRTRGQGRWVPPRPHYTCTSICLLQTAWSRVRERGRSPSFHTVTPDTAMIIYVRGWSSLRLSTHRTPVSGLYLSRTYTDAALACLPLTSCAT